MLRSGQARLTVAVVAVMVVATTTLSIAIPAASAQRVQRPGTTTGTGTSTGTGESHAGLGVVTVVSARGEDTILNFLFSGAEATAFLLAVPEHATLSTLSSTRVGHLISLATLGGVQVHYRVESVQPHSLLIKLHSPQPDLRLTFTPALFTWSPHEAALISAHRAGPVRMGVAFTGTTGPSQLIASKFTFTP